MRERRYLYLALVGFLVFLGLFVVGLVQHRKGAGEGDVWLFWSAAFLVLSALAYELAFTIYHIRSAHEETRRVILEKLGHGEVQ